MNTKKIILSLALFAALFSTSCEKFLEEDNKAAQTDELVFTSDKTIESLVAVCYAYNKMWYGKEAAFGLTEGGTDLWYGATGCTAKGFVDYQSVNPDYTTVGLAEYWESFYAGINTCNIAIKKTNDSPTLSETVKKDYMAQAMFLRAFYYWHLVETWGDVPLNTEPIDAPSTVAYRTPVEDVYQFMFKNVNDAISYLPQTTKPSSRVTYWAALAFKARLSLYYASEYGHANYYDTAYAVSKNILDNASIHGKSLYDNYADVWEQSKCRTSANNEFLWAVDYYDDLSTYVKYNDLPATLKLDPKTGEPVLWPAVINRTGTNNSNVTKGNVQHLFVTPIWNNFGDNNGGAPISDVLKRMAGPVEKAFYTAESPSTLTTLDVGYFYVTYAMGYNRYAPTKYCLDIFDETKDERWNVTFRTAWYKHPKAAPKNYGSTSCKYPLMSMGTNTDTVLFYSKHKLKQSQIDWAAGRYKVLDITYTFSDTTSGTVTTTGTVGGETFFAAMRKFENTQSQIALPASGFNDFFSNRDFPIFRISEIYLIAAEAASALGNGSEATTLINTLREKRAISGKEADMDVTLTGNLSSDIDLILTERALEFAGENIRWFDLKRTKKLETYVLRNTKSGTAFDKSKHYLRPIPSLQYNACTNRGAKSETTFWQNPGY